MAHETRIYLALVSSLLDSSHEEFDALNVALDVGRKATLISNVAGILTILLLDHTLEVMVHLQMSEVFQSTRRAKRGRRRVLMTTQASARLTVAHVNVLVVSCGSRARRYEHEYLHALSRMGNEYGYQEYVPHIP